MGQQLLFKPKHRVVPIHGHVYRKLELEVSRTMDVESKVYLLSIIHALGRKKKVQDCDYVFGSSTKFQRRMNGFVKADTCRQLSVCFHVFCGILFALKPFCDYSLCSVCILPQPAFYSQSAVCILHTVCILPLVRSLQSAVRSLRFTLTMYNIMK